MAFNNIYGQSLDCSSIENLDSASVSSHDDRNLVFSSNLSSVKNNLCKVKNCDKFNKFGNNSKKICNSSSHINSSCNYKSDIRSFPKSWENDCLNNKNFTSVSDSSVSSKVSFLNKNYFDENFETPLTRNSPINDLSESFLKVNSKNLLSKSPVKFACLKCGLGFPCTAFLCRRTNLLCDTQDSEVDDNTQIKSFDDSFQVATSRAKSRINTYFSQNECKFQNYKPPVDTNKNFLNEQNSNFISNKENSPPKCKMQCQNNLKELCQDSNLSGNATNSSIIEDTSTSDSKFVSKIQNNDDSTSKSLFFSNLFSPSRINTVEIQSSDLPIESLSQGTRNFLKELAASNTAKTSNEGESGYALSTINSPFSRKNKKNEILLDCNDNKSVSECHDVSINNDSVTILNDNDVTIMSNDVSLKCNANVSFLNNEDINKDVNASDAKNMPVLNDHDVTVPGSTHIQTEEKMSVSDDLNQIADTKDVVNALDLIEQSSLHDKEMSSAEICNSLNQIFSESNVIFSTTTDSNLDDGQVGATDTEYETVTFQTIDSNVQNIADVESGAINISDLCSVDNPENCQQILLVQDECGNIETVLLLPQNAQIVESLPSYEISTSESMQLSDNIDESTNKESEIQVEQCVFVNNVSTDKITDHTQSVLIMHDAVDNHENVLTINPVSEEQHKVVSESSAMETQALSSQKNLITDHNNLDIKSADEKNALSKKILGQFKENTSFNKNINFVNASSDDKTASDIIINNNNENTVLSQNKVFDEALNKQECLMSSQNSAQNVLSEDKTASDITANNTNENIILSQNKMSDETLNKEECLIKSSQNSVNNSIVIRTMDNTTLKRSCEEISDTFNNDFNDAEVCIVKETFSNDNVINDNNKCYKSLNELEVKSSINASDNDYSITSNNTFSVNSATNVSDSHHLTGVHISKAKKRFSVNGTNCLKPIDFNQCIQPSSSNAVTHSSSTPLNGAVYLFHNDSAFVQNYKNPDSSGISHLIESEGVREKTVQKSKKTIVPKLNNRTAKKTASISQDNSDIAQIYQLLKNADSALLNKIFENEENYIKAKNMLLKKGLKEDVIDYLLKHKINSNSKSTFNNETVQFNGVSKAKSRTVALKTFVKPFTAAKKSIFDYRKKSKNLNTALKTCMSRGPIKKNTALKSFPQRQIGSKDNFLRSDFQEKINSMQNQQKTYKLSESYFKPEVCEIRILPNEYVKRASDVLLKRNSTERPSTPEDNASEEEIKLPPPSNSPIERYTEPSKLPALDCGLCQVCTRVSCVTACQASFNELMLPKFHCVCVDKEVPCLCYDGSLQRICEAEDTFDEKIVPCTNHVSQHYLSTPSSEIKHRAFCDMHIWRLRHHHCCPKCGIFCSQGDFLSCSFENLEKKENHLFHLSCFIIPSPGLPPSCPHCCQFSNFKSVNLIYKSASDNEQKEVPSNAQNITSEINDCDIYLRVKEQDVTPDQSHDTYVPQKNMVELMIRSLAKENSFRLRPTGKCLYNPIKTGDVQKVMHLIGNGVNPNHKFRMQGNNAPLHVAAHYGWIGILHILIQAGAYIDSVNDDLETPLIVAVERKQLPVVRYLVLAGAQIDVKDCNGMTSFHIASKNGYREIAEFLYSTGKIDINLQDDGGWTALVWACEHKHVEFVQWLLEIGADPNVRDNEGNTVLHWAAYSGKYEIAQLLLDKGCTLSYVNKRGDSALHIAAREDNYECVKLFINRGAVLDQKNKENKTPLMCCQDDSVSFNYLCQSISSGALKIGKLQLEKHVVFRDISRGAEAYPIQAINEVDDEEFIMEFRYVVKHCHRSGVNIISTVDSMQFCYCKDNCVTRDCNCTMNSKCWYDANGCLTSECDLQSSPIIFECNKTCHCPKTCINRVVQQGLRFPLQIFRTRHKGWGVRALHDIPKGAFVCEYVGELITGTEATQRSDDTYLFDLKSQDSDYCLDGRYFGNVARFLNHSCEPNLIALKVFVDHQDMNFPRIAFFAYKKIRAFEELCFDYGLDFWIVKCQTILCVCNTQSCKYSKDTIDDTLWRFFMDTDNGEQLKSES